MFATGPRAVGFIIVWPKGVIFKSMMTYHVQFLLVLAGSTASSRMGQTVHVQPGLPLVKRIKDSLALSATDLVGYLNCRHLTELDRAVAEGSLAKPKVRDDPLLQLLAERGSVHEQNYVDHLTKNDLEPVRIDGFRVSDEAVSQTLAAMNRGAQVIVQGALSHDHWIGRADILRRIETPSDIGNWSYEVVDTKLARETKAGTVLQLCLYSDLLTRAQGVEPEYMYVVTPWSEFELQQYRFMDYAAYFRKVKRGLLTAMAERDSAETYPDPIEHCDICRWRETCQKRRRSDDHLCLVAGISKLQINELKQRGITTVKGLADMPLPLEWTPDRGSTEPYNRIREQARVQVEAREAHEGIFELLPVENGFGLTRLPEPSDGDIFFDLEGDPFVGERGLEYLFGYLFIGETAESVYRSQWAFSRAEEKQVFEDFVDFVMGPLAISAVERLCLLFIHPRDGDHGYTQPERAPGGRAVSGRTLQPPGPHRSMTGVDSTSLATSWSVSRYERRTKEERHPFEAC